MAYTTLKSAIQAVIKQNGNNEITGALLQQALLSMIDSLGAGFQFVGIATPDTIPGTPDQNVFYIAATAGTYSNFGGIVLADGEVAIISGSGTTWTKETTGIASNVIVSALNESVKKIDGALTIREYIELPETSLQLGKAVGLSGIVSDSQFNLYTYAIEDGKDYHIHAVLNAGWTNRYLVCFSTDAAGNDIVGFAYRGSTSWVYVPPFGAEEFYEKLNIPAGALYFHIGIRNTDYATGYLKVAYSVIQDDVFFNAESFNDRLTALEDGGLAGGNSITALYNNGDHRGKIRAIIKNIASGRGDETLHTNLSVPQPLSIIHFSDAHGSSVNFQRVLDYFALYQSEINDIIHTGDLVSDYFENGFSQLADLADFPRVLQVIGNHDTRKYNSEYEDARQWSEYAGKVAYDTYIAPYIANWGDTNNPITQPADAATVGKCYYYKDYTAKKIRLIVIDNMVMLATSENYDPNQITWFESVLADALQNELTVVVAMHFPNDDSVIDCPFTNYGRQPDSGDWASAQMAQFFDAVNTFKQNGGEFVCWFCGHIHTSLIGHPGTYTDQLIVAVGSTIMDGRGSFPRVGDTKTQDFFHLMGIDTYRKTLKVLQIGVEYDAYMRHRECFCYNYNTGTFIKMSE